MRSNFAVVLLLASAYGLASETKYDWLFALGLVVSAAVIIWESRRV